MGESTAGDAPPAPLACSDIIHRCLRNSHLVHEETGLVKAAAFLRRRDEDGRLTESGLSVDRASLRSSKAFAESFRKSHGVVSLHVGRIRDIGLDVVAAPPPPSNAEIIRLPDEPAEEERLAGLLAKQARWSWRP